MLGYGLVNSSVHELSLSQIVLSFLGRSSIFLANYYFDIYIKKLSGTLTDKDFDEVVNLFLEEEKYINIKQQQEKEKTQGKDPNFNENEILYKYFLSANIILDKDYNFDLKTSQQVVEEGRVSLRTLFLNVFNQFIETLNQDVGDFAKFPDFPDSKIESENFILELIKYSTFIFQNSSVAARNGFVDYKFNQKVKELKLNDINQFAKTSYSSIGQNLPNVEYNIKNPGNPYYSYFSSAGKFFNYGDIYPLLFGEYYYTAKQEKINELVNDVLELDPTLKNTFFDIQDVFRSSTYEEKYNLLQKLGYFNVEENKYYSIIPLSVNVDKLEPNPFGEAKPYPIFKIFGENAVFVAENNFQLANNEMSVSYINYSFEFPNQSETNLIKLPGGSQSKINTDFDNIKLYFAKIEDGKLVKLTNEIILTSNNWKDFIGGYITLVSNSKAEESNVPVTTHIDINYTKQYSDTATEIIKVNGVTGFTLSIKEILRLYKFSFNEVFLIANKIKDIGKKFEDYFQLNYRLILNLNADINKNSNISNHHLYELFNMPFPLEQADPLFFLNKFPPYFKNVYFRKEKFEKKYKDGAVQKSADNLLYNTFYIDFEKYKNLNKNYNDSVELLYEFLLKQEGKENTKKPEDNPLFKMLFRKEDLLFSAENYDTLKLRINYFITIADFVVDTKDDVVYYTDDAKESLFNIKKDHYKKTFDNLISILNMNEKSDFKLLMDSLKFDELKKIGEQVKNIKPLSIYKMKLEEIYNFYSENITEGNSGINLLTTRDISLKILDQQIEVLENG